MSHDTIVFHPRYTRKLTTALVVMPLIAVAGLIIAILDPDQLVLGIGSIFIAVIAVTGWLLLPLKIVFDESITIKRGWLPDRQIEYDDVDIGIGRLVSGRSGFSWIQMENGHELAAVIEQLVEKGFISESALEGNALVSDVASLYALYATMLGLLLVALLMGIGVVPTDWLVGLPDWVPRIIFPITLFACAHATIRYFLRHKDREESKITTKGGELLSNETLQFDPSVSRLLLAQSWGALLLLIGIPAGLATTIFKTDQVGIGLLLTSGIAGALLFVAYHVGVDLWRGINKVKISSRSIQVEDWRGVDEARWDEILDYEHLSKSAGGIRLRIRRNEQPMHIWFAGYSYEETNKLLQQILGRLGEAVEQSRSQGHAV